MTPVLRLQQLRRSAARRRLAILAAGALPLGAACIALVVRIHGGFAACALAAVLLGFVAALALRAWRRTDETWLARRLDAAAPCMDDSTALLFADADGLSRLQRLQQARLRERLDGLDADLRPAWPWRHLGAVIVAALALAILAARWPSTTSRSTVDDGGAPGAGQRDATALALVRIDVDPPAYTRLPVSSATALDAKAAEGSRLRWTLRFDTAPTAAALVFHDGRRLELTRDGADWRGEQVLSASALYRVALDGVPPLADDRLHRLDAIPDRPPEVRVIEPSKTLTLLDAGQKTWSLAFDAEDDYGVRAAELQLTLAQGSGENVHFEERTIALQGEPIEGTKRLRYRRELDLGALGVAQGDDLVVRAVVSDDREPQPNVTRSASFILRWPAEASNDGSGLEGVVQKTMPAYFRSQRQIIIDSEALLAERGALDEKTFLDRSDAIGVDQKILRLRYGQFLGEESETRAHAAGQGEEGHDDHGEAGRTTHGASEAPSTFGEAGDVVAEYGHVHDIAEAATLLDPETKTILKSALAEMWQAELHLRQGRPDEALPYEHRALEFVKQVQQSTRIYLARVGLELPAPDETRRLSGDRKGIEDRVGTLAPATSDGDAVAALWRSLSAGESPEWDTADAWLRSHEASVPDGLGILAALDRARRDPSCAECRTALRDLLWPLLPAPPAASTTRARPDAAGRAYLDAVQSGAEASR